MRPSGVVLACGQQSYRVQSSPATCARRTCGLRHEVGSTTGIVPESESSSRCRQPWKLCAPRRPSSSCRRVRRSATVTDSDWLTQIPSHGFRVTLCPPDGFAPPAAAPGAHPSPPQARSEPVVRGGEITGCRGRNPLRSTSRLAPLWPFFAPPMVVAIFLRHSESRGAAQRSARPLGVGSRAARLARLARLGQPRLRAAPRPGRQPHAPHPQEKSCSGHPADRPGIGRAAPVRARRCAIGDSSLTHSAGGPATARTASPCARAPPGRRGAKLCSYPAGGAVAERRGMQMRRHGARGLDPSRAGDGWRRLTAQRRSAPEPWPPRPTAAAV